MRLSPSSIGLYAAAATLVLGGTTAYLDLDKTVTISVDGQPHQVRTFATTVGALLDREHLSVGAHDLLVPARGDRLTDGERVELRYGRQVHLDIDGTVQDYWTTERTVGTALQALGVRVEGAYVSASRSMPIGRAGVAVGLRLPKTVTFLADGQRHTVTTTATSLADALAQAGLTLRARDSASVPLTDYPVDGALVTITRVDQRSSSAQQPVAFTTVRKASNQLYKGVTKVSVKGQPGVLTLTYADTYVDGKRTAHKLVTKAVTTPPVQQVVLYGTKSRPVARTTATSRSASRVRGSVSDLNWAALARCESDGNPRAVNPKGYYGLYQFSLGTWHSVGGAGSPVNASAAEQTYRAQLLYQRAGSAPWPVCGRYLYS